MEIETNKMTKQPSYRFAGYTESWEEKKLGEVSEKVREKNSENLYSSVLTNSAEFGIIPQRDYFDKDIANEKNLNGYYIVKQNDFVYNPRISNYAPVGPIKPNKLNEVGIMSPLYYVFRTHDIENSYLATYFDTTYWHKFMKINGDSGARADRFAIKDSVFVEMPIPFPSLSEQTAIGSFFQDIDQLISLQQRKLEVLKEQKKTYLKLLFPAKGQTKPDLRFAGFEDDWKEVKLGEVFDIVTDYVANGSFESLRNNVKTYEKDNFAYMIRLQDASNSWRGPWLYTDEKGYNFLSKSRLFKDDILMSNVGTVGRFFQVPELDRPMTLAPNSVLIRSTSSNNQFLYFMMLTPNIQDQITMRKTPGVQDKINKTDFKKVIATLPSLPEQEVIGSFFQDLDKAIAKQEEKVNQLKESKQTLLRKMFI
jgi:hypothetical protein